MSLVPNRRSLAVAARTGFNSTILALIDEFLLHEGIAKSDVHRYRYPARHFLIWLQCSGLAIESVDGTVIDDFLRHDCRCTAWSAPVRLRRWRKCRTSPYLMRFIHFLERTGRIETPGDLDENFRVLEAFLERLRGDSYATQTVKLYRYGCAGLLVWLHLSRIRLSDLTAEVYARFRNRQFVCSIPGVFCGHRAPSPGTAYATEVRGFLKHLVAIGRIEPLQPSPQLPGLLERFSVWLERNRGIGPGTVRQHVRLIARILPGLGDEPRTYDAARVRRVLFEQIKCWSPTYAQKLTTSMRMYLRFLVSEGYIAPALVEAVPTVPRWRLSGLPRYIPADDVERAIASCGDDALAVPTGRSCCFWHGWRYAPAISLPASGRYRLGQGPDTCIGKIAARDRSAASSGCRRRALCLYRNRAPKDKRRAGVPLRQRALWTVRRRKQCEFGGQACAEPRRRQNARQPRRLCVPSQSGNSTAQVRCVARCHPIAAPTRLPEHDHDLRQDRCGDAARSRPTLDRRRRTMTATISEHIGRFVAMKRKLGYRFESSAMLLQSFGRFAAARDERFLRSATAIEWASGSTATPPHQRARRLHALHLFACWLHAEDARHEVPPRNALGHAFKRRPQPHLVSIADIRKLLAAALSMEPAGTIAPLTWHPPLRPYRRDRAAHRRSACLDTSRHHA